MEGYRDLEKITIISMKELFKGAYFSAESLDHTINISNFTKIFDTEPFLKGRRNSFRLNSWNKSDKSTIISKCKDNNTLVDSVITDEVNKIIIIIQKKYMKKPRNSKEDQMKTGYPDKWFEEISKVEEFEELKEYKKIYVFITNANIPKKAKEVIKNRKNAIIIDQSVSRSFFSLNIFLMLKVLENKDFLKNLIIFGLKISGMIFLFNQF